MQYKRIPSNKNLPHYSCHYQEGSHKGGINACMLYSGTLRCGVVEYDSIQCDTSMQCRTKLQGSILMQLQLDL